MSKSLNSKIIIGIIILDLAWAAMAAIYDWEIFCQIPIYLWPFLVICPVFPALLSLVWLQILEGKPNNFLFAFSSISSVVYLFAAILYYPMWMVLNGFDWMTFGAIFWVMVYGAQGIYLLLRYSVKKSALFIVGLFLILSLLIQCWTRTAGSQDFTNFSSANYFALFASVALFVLLFSIILSRSNKK